MSPIDGERSKWTKTVVFVAMGDSLTVGSQYSTQEDELPEPTPYTTFLEEKTRKMLEESSVRGIRVEFVNRGINGELTEGMLGRFNRDVLGSKPDAVIILGGSNDLGWGLDPSSVAWNLTEMYRGALDHRIQPIACTIPSVLGFDEGIEPRLRLNQIIKKTCAALGILCVDLFTATADSAGRLRKEYSNDGLHLSTAGYEAMAEAMFSGAVSAIVTHYLGASPQS